MNKFFQYASYAGVALGLASIVATVKKTDRFLVCSPMMDDGVATPIVDYIKDHPGAKITKELGKQLLRDASEGG